MQKKMWLVVKIWVPFWGTLHIRCRIILGIQQRTIILPTTHVGYNIISGMLFLVWGFGGFRVNISQSGDYFSTLAPQGSMIAFRV